MNRDIYIIKHQIADTHKEDCKHTCCIPWVQGGIMYSKCLTCGALV